MFERFTDRARRVLVVAQNEARSLNHSFIGPEHLLLGLLQGDGVAAKALGQLGVRLEEARGTVAGAIAPANTNIGDSKVPFSRQAKKALELSLREALRLGHNYIGTEHLALGVIRAAGDDGVVSKALGVELDEVRARVLEVMRAGLDPARSPALVEAFKRAGELAGEGPMTSGQLLLALLADDACQASKALEGLGVTKELVESQLAQIPVGGTTDARTRPRAVGITLGRVTTTIEDPELAAAFGELSPEELTAALRRALGTDTARPGSDEEG